MKKTVLLMLLLSVVVLSSCAGMDPQHQQNMITNSAVWGGIGAATGCILFEALGGKCGQGAAIVGVGGAYLGAGNTPHRYGRQSYSPVYGSGCGSTYDCEYERETLRLERRAQREDERLQRERARQDARQDYR